MRLSWLGVMLRAAAEAGEYKSGGARLAPCHQCGWILRGTPKTGTTWTTAILRNITEQACEMHQKPNCAVCGECPSDHGKHSMDYGDNTSKRLRYVSTYRDPRDTAVSTFHWWPRAPSCRSARCAAKSASEYAIGGGCRRVVDDMNKQLDKEGQRSNGTRVLRVFYEATKIDPVGVISRIAEFIGNPITLEQAEAVERATNFDAMRAKEAAGEMKLRIHPDSYARLKGNVQDPSKLMGVMTRRGDIGAYVTELNATAKAICEAQMDRLRGALRARYLPTVAVKDGALVAAGGGGGAPTPGSSLLHSVDRIGTGYDTLAATVAAARGDARATPPARAPPAPLVAAAGGTRSTEREGQVRVVMQRGADGKWQRVSRLVSQG